MFACRGRLVITTSEDHALCVWEVAVRETRTHRLLAKFRAQRSLKSTVVSDSGTGLGLASIDVAGVVYMLEYAPGWHMSVSKAITAVQRAWRWNLLKEGDSPDTINKYNK